MNHYLKWLLTTGGLMCCILSLIYSVLLWSAIPINLVNQVLAGVTAFALEICKFSFVALIPAYFDRQDWRSFFLSGLLTVMSLVLIIVSIAATVGFLNQSYFLDIAAGEKQVLLQKHLSKQLESIEQQANTLNKSAAIDVDNTYRDRGVETIERVTAVEQQRKTVLQQLQDSETPGGLSVAEGLYTALGAWFSVDGQSVRLGVFVLFAVLLDVCGVVALFLLSVTRNTSETVDETLSVTPATPSVTPATPAVIPETPSVTTETLTVAPATHNVTNDTSEKDLEQKIAEVKKLIIAVESGKTISMRSAMKTGKIRHPIAKQIFDEFIKTGVLKVENNKYIRV